MYFKKQVNRKPVPTILWSGFSMAGIGSCFTAPALCIRCLLQGPACHNHSDVSSAACHGDDMWKSGTAAGVMFQSAALAVVISVLCIVF
jgi:hypothetical protein